MLSTVLRGLQKSTPLLARSLLSFAYANPTKILFGEGDIAQLPTVVPEDKKVFVIAGGGSIKRNGVYDQVVKALGDRIVGEFWGIEANPDFDTCLKCVEQVKEYNPEDVFLLAVGGGSVGDATKFISAAPFYTASDDLHDIFDTYGAMIEKAMPFGIVLTLPATGTESNPNSVISCRREKWKRHFGNPAVFPEFAILDPATTLSLPEEQTKNGVIDAIVHTCEQYVTCCHGAELQDRYAEGLLMLLMEQGKKVLADPSDIDARGNIMWAATNALNLLIGSGVPQDWATHMIGHEFTNFYGLDHGVTLAIAMPEVWRFAFEDKKEKLAQCAERVFGIKEGTVEEKATACIEAFERFFQEDMKVPTKLSAHGVTVSAEDRAAIIKSFAQRGMMLGEQGKISPDDIGSIIDGCL